MHLLAAPSNTDYGRADWRARQHGRAVAGKRVVAVPGGAHRALQLPGPELGSGRGDHDRGRHERSAADAARGHPARGHLELHGLAVNDDGTILAEARLEVEALEMLTGQLLEEDDRDEIDTVGGLVCAVAGRVPGRGEVVRHPTSMKMVITYT